MVGLGLSGAARRHGASSEIDADQVPTKLIVFCSLSGTYLKDRKHHYRSQKPQHRQFNPTHVESPFCSPATDESELIMLQRSPRRGQPRSGIRAPRTPSLPSPDQGLLLLGCFPIRQKLSNQWPSELGL